MQVSDVMIANPETVLVTQTFGEAFALLMERRISSLPVVDAAGIYKGMFDRFDVWQVLLPKAALLARDSLPDLSFMSNSADQLHAKLRSAFARPLSEFLDDEEAPPIHPETPLKEAILLFNQRGSHLPVVDRKTRRLVGLATPWELLEKLR